MVGYALCHFVFLSAYWDWANIRLVSVEDKK